VVEANVTERNSHSPVTRLTFDFPFRGDSVGTAINGYDIHEMLGTKMRALFQRRRGRDLFDLYWALEHAEPPVFPKAVVDTFMYYLREEGTEARRHEFTTILESHVADRGFCSDTTHLLREGVQYDAHRAAALVQEKLLNLLPE